MACESVADCLRRGLSLEQKFIPTWFIYDEHGFKSYDQNQNSADSKYLCCSEKEILTSNVTDILSQVPVPCKLIDLGSGTSRKTEILIDGLLRKQDKLTYIPVDFAPGCLSEACTRLSELHSGRLETEPLRGSYEEGIQLIKSSDKDKLIVWFEGLQNEKYSKQIQYLKMISDNMTGKDRLLLTLDITQDKQTVEKAYLDDTGNSAQYYNNAFERLNREYGSQIDPAEFDLHVEFVRGSGDTPSVLQAWATSKFNQSLAIPKLGIQLSLETGERMNFYEAEGLSHKYTIQQVETMAEKGSLDIVWRKANRHVGLFILKRKEQL